MTTEEKRSCFEKWLLSFCEEKKFDMYEMLDKEKELNLGKLIYFILSSNDDEQIEIKKMLVKIDFHNGDCLDYFKNLSQAISKEKSKKLIVISDNPLAIHIDVYMSYGINCSLEECFLFDQLFDDLASSSASIRENKSIFIQDTIEICKNNQICAMTEIVNHYVESDDSKYKSYLISVAEDFYNCVNKKIS